MSSLDTRPQKVDILHYGGDTLTIRIQAPSSLTDGMTWKADVKAARGSDVVDASFVVTPPVSSGGPAFLTLPAAVTAALVADAPIVTKRLEDRSTRSVQQYVGEWDCQISADGADPVTSLAQGTLTIELDVTRT